MARKNLGDCIKSTVVTFSGVTVGTIPAHAPASKALLQFYTDATGIETITPDVMAYQPLVSITENGDTPTAGFTGTKGIGIFHMGLYEIETKQNIESAKFIAWASGYTVYCKINYYK